MRNGPISTLVTVSLLSEMVLISDSHNKRLSKASLCLAKQSCVVVCAIKVDGPLDSHKFSSGSLKGWDQIDLVLNVL